MMPRTILVWLTAAWMALSTAGAWAQTPLRIGLFPNLSPRALITMYQPLRVYLEQELGRPVEMQTAPDFRVFTQRLLAGEYDVAVTAPHLARLAQTDAGYEPLVHYAQGVQAVLVVVKESNANKLGDLRGAKLAIPDALALVTFLGFEMLAEAGLDADSGYRIIEARSHNNAALNVINGQVDAAIIGSVPFMQMTPDIRRQLRILKQSRAMPSQYFIASKQLPAETRASLTRALLRYPSSPEGTIFFEHFAMRGMVKASANELNAMDPYSVRVRKLLNPTPGP